MKKPKVSVALAVFNEEKNLPGCLDSVSNLADEVVVVDGSSTDKTVVVAKKYKAKVIITDNPPIFHINKQKALDACRGDWILQLDADERVTPALRKEILEVTTATPRRSPSAGSGHSPRSYSGYWIPRKNYFLGRYLTKGGQYPDYTLRLYRRGKGKLPCKSVHEQAEVEGWVGYLKNDLLHHPYPNFSEYLNKANRYAKLFADDYHSQKVRTDFWGWLKYLLIIPKMTFLKIYFRHKGFVDGFAGFIFALFSAIQKIIAYVIYWEKNNVKKL